MAQVTTLAVEERATKGTARAIRRTGRIPGVIYGNKQPPVTVSVDSNALNRQLEKPGFFIRLVDLEIDGKKHRVLPRDVQYDPVSDRPLHIDFLRVSPDTKIRVGVPVVFLNADKSPGIKRGGTLNIVHHEIEILCAPDKIPEKFEVSLEGLQINDAVHLSALKLPPDIKLTTREKDYTVATIAVPSAIRAEQEEAAAAKAAAEAAAAAPVEGAMAADGAVAEGAAAATPAAAAAPADAKKGDAKGAAAPAADAKKEKK